MPNTTIPTTSFKSIGRLPEKLTLDQLKTALDNLNVWKSNVKNCNCSPSNCCQSNCSYTCQSCQGCQTCQSTSAYNCSQCSECRQCTSSDCWGGGDDGGG